eukprot:5381483-Amphidinium_carterae.2
MAQPTATVPSGMIANLSRFCVRPHKPRSMSRDVCCVWVLSVGGVPCSQHALTEGLEKSTVVYEEVTPNTNLPNCTSPRFSKPPGMAYRARCLLFNTTWPEFDLGAMPALFESCAPISLQECPMNRQRP